MAGTTFPRNNFQPRAAKESGPYMFAFPNRTELLLANNREGRGRLTSGRGATTSIDVRPSNATDLFENDRNIQELSGRSSDNILGQEERCEILTAGGAGVGNAPQAWHQQERDGRNKAPTPVQGHLAHKTVVGDCQLALIVVPIVVLALLCCVVWAVMSCFARGDDSGETGVGARRPGVDAAQRQRGQEQRLYNERQGGRSYEKKDHDEQVLTENVAATTTAPGGLFSEDQTTAGATNSDTDLEISETSAGTTSGESAMSTERIRGTPRPKHLRPRKDVAKKKRGRGGPARKRNKMGETPSTKMPLELTVPRPLGHESDHIDTSHIPPPEEASEGSLSSSPERGPQTSQKKGKKLSPKRPKAKPKREAVAGAAAPTPDLEVAHTDLSRERTIDGVATAREGLATARLDVKGGLDRQHLLNPTKLDTQTLNNSSLKKSKGKVEKAKAKQSAGVKKKTATPTRKKAEVSLKAEAQMLTGVERTDAERLLRKAGISAKYAKKLARKLADADTRGSENITSEKEFDQLPELEKEALLQFGFGPTERVATMRQNLVQLKKKHKRGEHIMGAPPPGVPVAPRASAAEAASQLFPGAGRAPAVPEPAVPRQHIPPLPKVVLLPSKKEVEALLVDKVGLSDTYAKRLARKLQDPDVARILPPRETADRRALESYGFWQTTRKQPVQGERTTETKKQKDNSSSVLLQKSGGGSADQLRLWLNRMAKLRANKTKPKIPKVEDEEETGGSSTAADKKSKRHKKPLELDDTVAAFVNAGISRKAAQKLAKTIVNADQSEGSLLAKALKNALIMQEFTAGGARATSPTRNETSTSTTQGDPAGKDGGAPGEEEVENAAEQEQTVKLLSTLGFDKDTTTVADAMSWVREQVRGGHRERNFAARTLPENTAENALLTTGMSAALAGKLAKHCADAGMHKDADLTAGTDVASADLQLLKQMGLFGETETVGNLRCFLHQKLEQKYGVNEETGELLVETTDMQDSVPPPLDLGNAEEAFVAQGFSKAASQKLAKTAVEHGNKTIQSTETFTGARPSTSPADAELRNYDGFGENDLALLSTMLGVEATGGQVLDVRAPTEAAVVVAGFAKRHVAMKAQVSLDLSTAVKPLEVELGNAEQILVIQGFAPALAKRVAKAVAKDADKEDEEDSEEDELLTGGPRSSTSRTSSSRDRDGEAAAANAKITERKKAQLQSLATTEEEKRQIEEFLKKQDVGDESDAPRQGDNLTSPSPTSSTGGKNLLADLREKIEEKLDEESPEDRYERLRNARKSQQKASLAAKLADEQGMGRASQVELMKRSSLHELKRKLAGKRNRNQLSSWLGRCCPCLCGGADVTATEEEADQAVFVGVDDSSGATKDRAGLRGPRDSPDEDKDAEKSSSEPQLSGEETTEVEGEFDEAQVLGLIKPLLVLEEPEVVELLGGGTTPGAAPLNLQTPTIDVEYTLEIADTLESDLLRVGFPQAMAASVAAKLLRLKGAGSGAAEEPAPGVDALQLTAGEIETAKQLGLLEEGATSEEGAPQEKIGEGGLETPPPILQQLASNLSARIAKPSQEQGPFAE
ncbi:unnamed protein product [Amoebophrya sp. A120]|nr:unnamed protein product [Amoebophrya sp. A120]|eukprot:GSA120T00010697001.1